MPVVFVEVEPGRDDRLPRARLQQSRLVAPQVGLTVLFREFKHRLACCGRSQSSTIFEPRATRKPDWPTGYGSRQSPSQATICSDERSSGPTCWIEDRHGTHVLAAHVRRVDHHDAIAYPGIGLASRYVGAGFMLP